MIGKRPGPGRSVQTEIIEYRLKGAIYAASAVFLRAPVEGENRIELRCDVEAKLGPFKKWQRRYEAECENGGALLWHRELEGSLTVFEGGPESALPVAGALFSLQLQIALRIQGAAVFESRVVVGSKIFLLRVHPGERIIEAVREGVDWREARKAQFEWDQKLRVITRLEISQAPVGRLALNLFRHEVR